MFLKQIIGTVVCVLFLDIDKMVQLKEPLKVGRKPDISVHDLHNQGSNDFLRNDGCILRPVWLLRGSTVLFAVFAKYIIERVRKSSLWSSMFHQHLTYKVFRVMPWKVSFAKNVRLFFGITLWDWSRSTSRCNRFHLAGYVYLRLVILSKSTVPVGGDRNFRSGYRPNFPPFCLFAFCFVSFVTGLSSGIAAGRLMSNLSWLHVLENRL